MMKGSTQSWQDFLSSGSLKQIDRQINVGGGRGRLEWGINSKGEWVVITNNTLRESSEMAGTPGHASGPDLTRYSFIRQIASHQIW